ncbi:MAG: hypothetical protein HY261_10265 [Chloroflexi bacterium]|nr:hypothetical protein [Chloroflexota bacterium]
MLSTVLLAAIAGITVLVANQIAFPDPDPSRVHSYSDQYYYVRMAQAPFSDGYLTHTAPFCWRLLMPLLAYALPFSLQANFYLLMFAGLLIATFGLYLYLADLGFSRSYRFYGIAAFATLSGGVGYAFRNFYLVDPLLLAAISISFLLLRRQRWLALAAVLALGAFNRETILLVFPAFLVLEMASRRDESLVRRGARLVAVFLPAVAVVVGVHLAIDHVNNYGIAGEAHRAVSLRFGSGPRFLLDEAFRWTLGAWGVLAILMLVRPARQVHRLTGDLRWALVLLVAAYAQLFFASPHVERLVTIAFPAMCVLALGVLSDLSATFDLSPPAVMGLIAVPHLVVFFGQMYAGYSPTPTPDTVVTKIGGILSVICLALLQAIVFARASRLAGPLYERVRITLGFSPLS